MRKEKQPKVFNLNQFILWTLRRASYRTRARSQALQACRVPVPFDYPNKRLKNLHRCAACQHDFPQKEVQVDHIVPVINPETGFTTWDDFMPRMFCGAEGLQVLCKPCHKEKTNRENQIRRQN